MNTPGRLLLLAALATPVAASQACSSSDIAEPVVAFDGSALDDGSSDAPLADSGNAGNDTGMDGAKVCPPLIGKVPPVVTCTKTFGDGVSRLLSTGVAADPDGNILLTGFLYGTADFGGGPLTTAGDSDAFVVKLDAQCNHVWSKRFGDADIQGGTAIATDKSGSVIVGFAVQGTIDLGEGPLTPAVGALSNMAIAKFDPCGNLVWAKRFGGKGGVNFHDLATDAQGNIVAVGGYVGELDFGGGPLPSTPPLSTEYVFVAKLDTNGSHVWSKSFGVAADAGQRQAAAGSLAIGPNAEIYVSGVGNQTIDFGLGPLQFPSDRPGAWFARFAPEGTLLSAIEVDDAVFRQTVASGGDLYVAAGLTGPADLGTGPLLVPDGGSAYRRACIGRFDPAGFSPAWLKAFGSSIPISRLDIAGLAATDSEVAFSASCAGQLDYGGSDPCTDGSQILVRYARDGGFTSASPLPGGPIAVSPPGQFVAAGARGLTVGGPEKITVTKLGPP